MLIHLIDRRMAKWPDEALVKLEALTRTPETMQIPPAADQPPARVPHPAEPKPAQVILGPRQENYQQAGTMTRREVFFAGAGGFVALLGGAGWWRSTDKLQSVRGRLTSLRNIKDRYDSRMHDYQAKIPNMSQRILNLQDITAQVNDLFASLNEDESFKKMDITSITSIIFILGDKLQTFIAYLSKVPDLIQASQKILAELDGWFSVQNSVDTHLLLPIQNDLFHSIEDISDQVRNL